jgi:5'-nucleotidase
MRNPRGFAKAGEAAAAAVALALVLAPHAFPSRAYSATLVHTNDVMGDIEPCGCRTNPLGGMARKATLLKRLADPSVLQLDAGDLLFSTDVMPELLASQAELQATYLLRSMDDLRHDAAVPGEKDFALGLKRFQKLVSNSRIKYLAANLYSKQGKKLFADSAIFTLQDEDKPLKVAVFGLVGEAVNWPKELKARPALPAAKAIVPALRKKADLVIALTHQGLEADQALAKAVPGIDIIIGGHTQSFLQQPVIVVGKNGATTTIYQSSFRNQYVGSIPLHKDFKGEGYKLSGLDAGYDAPADAPSKTDGLVKEFKGAIAELNAREEAKLAEATPSANGVDAPKFQTFPKCAECHLKQFDFWRKTQHVLALGHLIEKNQSQNKECLTCHTVGLGDPQGLKFISRLAETKRLPKPVPSREPEVAATDEDPASESTGEPISIENFAKYLKSIHDAGSLKDEVKIAGLEPQSIRRSVSALNQAWTPVQCENCHQPGKEHPFSGTYSKKVEKTTCLKCHTAERAPEWYTQGGKADWAKIDAKFVQITCPAGDLGPSAEGESD